MYSSPTTLPVVQQHHPAVTIPTRPHPSHEVPFVMSHDAVHPRSVDKRVSCVVRQTQQELMRIKTLVVGDADEFWIPREGLQHGLLETIHLKSGGTSWVTTTVAVGTRPSEELTRNYFLYNGEKVNLNQDFFKSSRLQFAIQKLAQAVTPTSGSTRGGEPMIRGEVLKNELRDQLPSLLKSEYLIVQYRDYSKYALQKLPVRHRQRDGLLGRTYVTWGFAVRIGQEIGTFIPLTEMQYIHLREACAERSAVRPCSNEALDQKAAPVLLSEEQFNSALAVAQSVHAANIGHDAEGVPIVSSFPTEDTPFRGLGILLAPWRWKSEFSAYRDRQYRRVGRLFTHVATLSCIVASLYIGIYGYQAFRMHRNWLVRSASSSPSKANRKSSQAPILTTMQSLWESGDVRVVLDYLLAPSRK